MHLFIPGRFNDPPIQKGGPLILQHIKSEPCGSGHDMTLGATPLK